MQYQTRTATEPNSDDHGNDGSTHGSTMERIKDKGKEKAREAGHAARNVVESRKEGAAERLEHLASSVRSASEELRANEEDLVARYANIAADQVADLADYLRTRSLSDLGRDASRAARDHPAVFLGCATAAGVLIGRFLRCSADDDDRDRGITRQRSYSSAGGTTAASAPMPRHPRTPPQPVGSSYSGGPGGPVRSDIVR